MERTKPSRSSDLRGTDRKAWTIVPARKRKSSADGRARTHRRRRRAGTCVVLTIRRDDVRDIIYT